MPVNTKPEEPGTAVEPEPLPTAASPAWGKAASVLAAAIGLLIVGALSGFVYLYLTGVIDPPAPRSAVEARLSVIESYLQTSPKNGQVWADYVLINTSLNRYADAEKVWRDAHEELAELPDELIQADLAWAQALMLQGRPEDAITQADLVIANDPVAVLARGTKNPSMLEMGLVKTGMLGPAQVVRGNSFVVLERWSEAVEAYTAALAEDPRAADLLALRAGAYLELGEFDNARADAEEALRFLPEDERARAVLEELGDRR